MASISEEHLQEAAEVGLTQPEAEQAWRCFTYIDENGSGTIDESELRYAMQLHGCDVSESSAKKLLSEADSDGSGTLNFKEYCSMLKKKRKDKADRIAKLRGAFEKFDSDGSGYLDRGELKDALTSMGMEPLEDEEIDDMFSMADSDADGKLSIDEFVRVLTMDLEDMIDQSTGY
ncbi:hypothetical protein BOX15_Mlig029060g2 [Macrostomum lignano]|uniref:EF-hand domain-containing protein n=1 Tax=Macrostomum lignano TaxID=282301 RepID=A0A267GW00_9PLAT|nr:hypothetical protein BOX15_Mlig029060g2 [Macrostomum lignano]